MTTISRATLSRAMALVAAASAAPLLAEPVHFVNNNQLVWFPGANNALIIPFVNPCDSASSPALPATGFRALDLTRGPEQYAPTSPYPCSASSICYQGPAATLPSFTPEHRRFYTGGNPATVALGATLVPPPGVVISSHRVLASFAPGMTVGPANAYSDNSFFAPPSWADNPTDTGHNGARPNIFLMGNRQFIGLQFTLPDGVHYAWMLLQRTDNWDTFLTPLEWGYETTPNTPVRILSTRAATPALPTSPATPTAVGLFPTFVTVPAGQSIQLYGGAVDPVSTAVTWFAARGTISPTGLYTAPLTPGNDSVLLSSVHAPTVSASAFIVVTAPPCPADFNHDNVLDPDDLSDYIGCFFAVPPCQGADFNHDNVTDPDDLSDYIGAFFNGC